MGVFSKLKNIFYDEEVIEEPEVELKKIDKEVRREVEKPRIEEIKVMKPEPVREEVRQEIKQEEPKLEDSFVDRELFRSERKFSFTELDDDVDDLPPRKSVLNTETRTKQVEKPVQTEIETPRVFKPSPIISPIYGILDKDYKKEEIVPKKQETTKEVESNAKDYDYVRRKAYGTLEDDLEDTLNSMNKITPEVIKEEVKKIDTSVEELENKSNKIEELINKIENNTNENVSVGELEDKLEIEHFDDEEDEEDEKTDKTMTDSTLEHDLFNLIDSMYDDKED